MNKKILLSALPALALTSAFSSTENYTKCEVRSVNQHSVHEGTDILIKTDLGDWIMQNVEEYQGKESTIFIQYSDEESLEKTVIPGKSGLTSFNQDLKCAVETVEIVKPVTSTTVKPSEPVQNAQIVEPVETTFELTTSTATDTTQPVQTTLEKVTSTTLGNVETTIQPDSATVQTTTTTAPQEKIPAAQPAKPVMQAPTYTG